MFASASHDQIEPATAHIVAEGLGVDAPAFDAKNACNSFINGAEIAEAFIKTGRASRALVVSGETPSSSPGGRSARSGSFAGRLSATPWATSARPRFRAARRRTRHRLPRPPRDVRSTGGSSRCRAAARATRRSIPTDCFSDGDGTALRDAFLEIDADHMARLFAETGTCWDDYAVVCAHQVAVPFIEDLVRKTGLPMDRLVLTVDAFGNVSSGSLPLSLASPGGRPGQPGDRVIWIGLGAGISVAAMAFVL